MNEIMITNTIPVSQVQIGDKVLFRRGAALTIKKRFFTLERIREINNGTVSLHLNGKREMTVLKKGEVTIKV